MLTAQNSVKMLDKKATAPGKRVKLVSYLHCAIMGSESDALGHLSVRFLENTVAFQQ